MEDHQFFTTIQLALTFGVSRDVMREWLAAIGLRTPDGMPSKKAVESGMCKMRKHQRGIVLVFWHGEKIVAALQAAGHPPVDGQRRKEQMRGTLGRAIAATRPILAWGDIQEVVIAMKVKEHGVEIKII